MKINDTTLADSITIALMAIVLLATVAALIGDWKKDIIVKQIIETQEAIVVEYERLPDIVINDPILPRALPPLIEGGEVYFEEMYYHKHSEDL